MGEFYTVVVFWLLFNNVLCLKKVVSTESAIENSNEKIPKTLKFQQNNVIEHEDHSHVLSPSEHKHQFSFKDDQQRLTAENDAISIIDSVSLPNLSSSTSLSSHVRRVDDTKVSCQKNHMVVSFKFSAPFNGYIYPYDHYNDCILYAGRNSHEATLTLNHGICGRKVLANQEVPGFTARIEHRLMIQWEKDFVGEDDSSIIIRCVKPDDFNKTVSWGVETAEFESTLKVSQHPGPKMWMDIQRGEGPNAPSLDSNPVFVGDVLTIVFTLQDDVFWFGSNILSCTAVDGIANEVETVDQSFVAPKPSSGYMTVIENECSTKPTIFSHFYKERITKDGNLINLHYAHFKAFRFPVSLKIVLQCDIKVCYKDCEPLPPCSAGFQPRSSVNSRERRSPKKDDSKSLEGKELETVAIYRTIEIHSAEDVALKHIPVQSVNIEPDIVYEQLFANFCYSSRTFFGWITSLSCIAIMLLIVIMWQHFKAKSQGSRFTPTK